MSLTQLATSPLQEAGRQQQLRLEGLRERRRAAAQQAEQQRSALCALTERLQECQNLEAAASKAKAQLLGLGLPANDAAQGGGAAAAEAVPPAPGSLSPQELAQVVKDCVRHQKALAKLQAGAGGWPCGTVLEGRGGEGRAWLAYACPMPH